MVIRHSPLLFASAFLCAALHAAPPPTPQQTEWIQKKLESTIIPRLEFREVGVVEAVEFLRKKAVELDPLRAGVPIYLRLQPVAPPAPPIRGLNPSPPVPPPSTARITVSLTNIPLSEALRYVSSLAGLKYRVLLDGVHVVPLDDPDPLYDREFALDPDMVQALQRVPTETVDAEQPKAPIADMKAYLSANGALFPQGAIAALDETQTRLRVRSTIEQIELIENILAGLLAALHPEPEPPIPGPDVPKIIGWPDGTEDGPIRRKAESLVLGQVVIVNATLSQAVDHLREVGVQYDVQETDSGLRGLNVVIKLETESDKELTGGSRTPASPPPAATPRINYVAQNVRMIDALHGVAKAAGWTLRFQPYAAVFSPKTPVLDESLVTIEYLVPPELVGRGPSGKEENTLSQKQPGEGDWLTSSGVPFSPNVSAIYISASRRLIVRNTFKQQRVVKEIVEKAWKEHYEAHPPTPAAAAPSNGPP